MTEPAYLLMTSLGSGAVVGLILGLLGAGGSILATPLLLYVVGVSQPHVAIGTGAVAVSASAFANLLSHARHGHVRWLCAFVFAAVGTLGALVGSSLGKSVDGQWLLLMFGGVMVAVGVAMLRPRRTAAVDQVVNSRRHCMRAAVAAVLAGAASGFFGIGGGFLIVPALIWATGMSMPHAIGTSLFAIGTFGLATALNYAASGWVDWQLAGWFIAGGIAGGVLGTAMSVRLAGHRNVLARIFAATVFVAAAYVLYRSGSNLFDQYRYSGFPRLTVSLDTLLRESSPGSPVTDGRLSVEGAV